MLQKRPLKNRWRKQNKTKEEGGKINEKRQKEVQMQEQFKEQEPEYKILKNIL